MALTLSLTAASLRHHRSTHSVSPSTFVLRCSVGESAEFNANDRCACASTALQPQASTEKPVEICPRASDGHVTFTTGEFVPEKLRLWDDWDWSVDSLLPFEYGPSSAETAEGCGRRIYRTQWEDKW